VIDHLRPTTALWAGAALWAAGLLLLAFAGLGGRLPTTEIAPGSVPALPQLNLQATPSRLGPLGDYVDIGARPLLAPDRRPSAVLAADGATGDLDASLTSVLITPQLRMAIFTDNQNGNSRRVRLGEAVPGTNWQLVQLEARRAVLEGPSGQRSLELRVYDGKGGSAPTSVPPPTSDGAAPTPAESNVATPATTANVPPPAPVPAPTPAATPSQEDQVAEIRRRIEARRAQMRAEAARDAQERDKEKR
jgi:general secretion pathway protein N